MMSTIHTIYPKVNEKHPNLTPEEIKTLLDLYFDCVESEIKNGEKSEISWALGTFKASKRHCKKRIEEINGYLNSTSFKGKRKEQYSEWAEKRLIQLSKRLENITYSGKIVKSGKYIGRTAALKMSKLERSDNVKFANQFIKEYEENEENEENKSKRCNT